MMGAAERISDLRSLLSIVAEDTGALKMSDADEDSVGWTEEGPLPMTFGHVRRAHSALAALEAALSAAEPVSSRNDEAGYVEFLNQDVPYIVRKIQGAVAILMDLETRNVVGYRVYDPDSVFAPPAPSVAVKAKPDGYLTPTMPGECWHSWKSCAISEPGARPFYFSPVMANEKWKELDDAFSNFINGYGDPFKPKRNHEKETERNVKALSEAFNAARSALSAQVQDVAGWQSIETAPKDGSQFLAFGIGGYFNCWWHDNGYGEQYWMDDADSEPNPSHWMALPAAPAKQEGGE
ncbi:hypothetical protein RGK87_04435 [Agrobacterium fabacearum]|uniref:hypothetical protein n=1 Tax=Agrobacterium tumefaciens TaxID=358 RepID=UPI002853201A|nr:hypothetical protein [Agrobacterium tumefaciens]MDR5008255.1 hypothetical protein [Agrobacterium tumefaciens]